MTDAEQKAWNEGYKHGLWQGQNCAKPAASGEPVAKWDDPRVQAVYQTLCSEEVPPPAQHWEGWTARRIVDAITAQTAPAPYSPRQDETGEWP